MASLLRSCYEIYWNVRGVRCQALKIPRPLRSCRLKSGLPYHYVAVKHWLAVFLEYLDLVRLATQPKSSEQEAGRHSVGRNNPR